jgi:hypothetical protein
LLGAANGLDGNAVHEFANVRVVKPSLAEPVARILRESSTLTEESGKVEPAPPVENTAVPNDRGNHFGNKREERESHAMTV